MKIPLNKQVCLLLDKAISINPKPNNYNSYTKEYFLNSLPDTALDAHHGKNINFLGMTPDSGIYVAAAAKLLNAKTITNAVIYPAKGLMGWHTNSDLLGTRVYYTKTTGEAIFSYLEDNIRYDDYDVVNAWTCRQFSITREKPIWHSIWTEKHRYSFGFLL